MRSTTAWLCASLASLTGGPPPAPPADWADVVRVAEAESVAPALGFALSRHPDDAVPPAVAGRLRGCFRQSLARHVVASGHLAALLGALNEASIPVIPLKGAVLAETVYPHPALRPMSDLDVLVHPHDRLRTDAVLRGLGYRPGEDAHSFGFDMRHDAAVVYDGPGGARVDMHWRLLNDPRFAWDHAGAEAVWKRARPVTLAGQPALALAPEDLVLASAAHLAIHHGLSGLLWYWDLALVSDRLPLDWDVLACRARRWRVRGALAFVLDGVHARFGLDDAARAAADRLAPRGPRAAALRSLVARRPDRLRDLEHVIPLLLADRLGGVLGGIASAMVPSPGWIRDRYGAASHSLARGYLAHGARMATVLRRVRAR